jgi:hypothetical protein
MKSLRFAFLQVILLFLVCHIALATPRYGFYLPDSVNEMTLKYRCIKNLIILPVVINDSIRVNLILDTGCRNLVLFGKRFQKLLKLNPARQIQFSGLGSGSPVHGFLSLSNRASIQQVLGEKIPVVVVPDRNILSLYRNIDGVIGYDIFLKFEIELNPREHTITFRPAARATAPLGYAQVPLQINGSMPVMRSEIQMDADMNRRCDLMIDTGSTMGLLVKTTNITEFNYTSGERVIGLGFNGAISGYNTISEKVQLEGFEMKELPTGVIESPWHNYASIGMGVLKDYVIVLNYCKLYACFKKINA